MNPANPTIEAAANAAGLNTTLAQCDKCYLGFPPYTLQPTVMGDLCFNCREDNRCDKCRNVEHLTHNKDADGVPTWCRHCALSELSKSYGAITN
jgi:hypothetical protein